MPHDPALDKVGIGLEDRKDRFGIRSLLETFALLLYLASFLLQDAAAQNALNAGGR